MERPRRTRAHRGRRPRPLRSRQPHPSSCVVRGVGCGVERRHAHTPRRAARARPASASPPRSCCGGGSDLVKRLLTVDEVPARACRARWSTQGRASTHGNTLHHNQVSLVPSLTTQGVTPPLIPSLPPTLPLPLPPFALLHLSILVANLCPRRLILLPSLTHAGSYPRCYPLIPSPPHPRFFSPISLPLVHRIHNIMMLPCTKILSISSCCRQSTLPTPSLTLLLLFNARAVGGGTADLLHVHVSLLASALSKSSFCLTLRLSVSSSLSLSVSLLVCFPLLPSIPPSLSNRFYFCLCPCLSASSLLALLLGAPTT